MGVRQDQGVRPAGRIVVVDVPECPGCSCAKRTSKPVVARRVTGQPSRRSFLVASGAVLATVSMRGRRPVVDVRDHGARGNGKRLDTKAIQRAVDAAAKSRGTVVFRKGTYLAGSLELRSGVRLVIERRATLLASPRTRTVP